MTAEWQVSLHPDLNYAFQCLTFDKNYQATMRFVAAIGVTTILIQNHKISQRKKQLQHFVKKAIGESAYNFFLFISSLSKQPRKTWQHWKVHDKLLNLIMKSNLFSWNYQELFLEVVGHFFFNHLVYWDGYSQVYWQNNSHSQVSICQHHCEPTSYELQ